jgi:hypothetical protein
MKCDLISGVILFPFGIFGYWKWVLIYKKVYAIVADAQMLDSIKMRALTYAKGKKRLNLDM